MNYEYRIVWKPEAAEDWILTGVRTENFFEALEQMGLWEHGDADSLYRIERRKVGKWEPVED